MTPGRRIGLLLLILLVAIGVGAAQITRETLASGTGVRGDWKVVASWMPGEGYCVKKHEPNGEGGSCGFAQPPTIDEAGSHLVVRGEYRYTLVTGPVPERASFVQVVAQSGDEAEAEIGAVFGMRFFVAELRGVHPIRTIVATDADGEVVAELEHAMPPPYFNDSGTPRLRPSRYTPEELQAFALEAEQLFEEYDYDHGAAIGPDTRAGIVRIEMGQGDPALMAALRAAIPASVLRVTVSSGIRGEGT